MQLGAYRWGVPPQAVLDQAVALRQRLDAQAAQLGADASDRCCSSSATTASRRPATELGDEGLDYLDAADGDGRVPLASALLPGVRTWRCDGDARQAARRAAMPSPPIVELLGTGDTQRLPRLEPAAAGTRGAGAARAPTRGRRWCASRPSRGRRGAAPPSLPGELFASGGEADGGRAGAGAGAGAVACSTAT